MVDLSNFEARRQEALGDLRKCIAFAEEMGELEIIEGADPNLEMGALYELSLRRPLPPILLFKKIKGHAENFSVAVNVRSSKVLNNGVGLDLVRNYRRNHRKKTDPIAPEMVATGPVMENEITGDAVNILTFPLPKWHKEDGGPYIGTECMIITKDPDSDWVNSGTYRTQVQNKDTLSVFIEPGKHADLIREKYWKRGQHCPMLISVGQPSVLGAVAATALPENQTEYAVAGGRLGRPIQLVTGKVTGIPFPADCELVYEGFMPPPSELTMEEGPFGEWPGYYASNSRAEPVLKVKAIYHRNDPIMTASPPAKPTYPGTFYGTAGSGLLKAAAIWDELEAAGVPGVKGVWKMPGGGSRFINVIAIEQMHSGHAKMAGLVATGCGSGAYLGRITIIVDHDIDITNAAEVMWAVATRWDPKTATDIIDGCYTGYIDPIMLPERRANGDMTNSRAIIYATRPYHWKDEFPKVNKVEADYAAEIEQKWKSKLKFLQEDGE